MGLPVAAAKAAVSRGEGLDVVAGAGDGHADQEGVGRGVLGDDRQDVAEQAAVGEQGRRDVDRICGRGEARQDAAQGLARAGLPTARAASPAVGRSIGRHDAGRARVADGDQTPARRLPALEVEFDAGHELGRGAGAQDAVRLEQGVDETILVRKRAGVRARRLLPGRSAAGLQRDDRQAALARDLGQGRQVSGVGDALQVEQKQAQVRIVGDRGGKLGTRSRRHRCRWHALWRTPMPRWRSSP